MRMFIVLIFILSEFISAQNFTVETRLIKGAIKSGGKAEIEYSVERGDSVIYSIIKKYDYDIPFGQAKCDDKGNLIIANAIDASIEIFDRTRTLQTKVFLTGSPSIEYERSLFFDILNDKIVAGLSDPSFEASEIYLVSYNGGAAKKILLPERLIGVIAASETGNYFAVSAYNSVENGIAGMTYIYNAEGKKMNALTEYFTSAEFSADDEMLLGYTNREVKLFNRTSGELIESFSAADGRILTAKYFSDKIFIIEYAETKLADGMWNYFSPELIKLVNGKAVKIDAEMPGKTTDARWHERAKSLGLKINGSVLIKISE